MIGDKIYGIEENANGALTIYGVIGIKQYYLPRQKAVRCYMDSAFYASRN